MRSVALLPSIALLAGACAGVALATPLTLGVPALVALWAIAWAAWVLRQGPAVVAAALAAYALAGAILGGAAAARALDPPLRRVLEHAIGGFALSGVGPPAPHDPLPIRARLLEDAAPRAGSVSLRVAVERVTLSGVVHDAEDDVRLTIGGASVEDRAREWRAGRVIDAPVTFRRPARYLNDGVRDFERDLALDGVALSATVKSGLLVQVVQEGSVFAELAADARAHVRASVGRWVARHDPLAAAIVTAILIGDRTGLPDDIRVRLQAAGTYHVIAISGGNIAILAALIAAALLVTGAGGARSALAIIASLLVYASIVAAGPSVWRATATAVAYLAARLFDHRSPPWNAMAVSAALLVCLAPLDVRDVGFALTFGATAAILEAARRVRGAAHAGVGSWLLASAAASLAAELVLLPIVATAFSRVTFAGLVLNLVAVPVMTVAQLAGLAVVFADGMTWAAWICGLVAVAAARALVESARLVDVLPWLAVRVPAPHVTVVAIYYVALASTLWLRRARVVSTGLTVGCGLVMLTGLMPAVRSLAPPDHLRLTIVDVGQGEALLLQTPGRRAVLVDSGGVGFDGAAFDIGGRVLAPALWARGVRGLDVLALTHGDPDHIGGAAAVIHDFAPVAIWEGVPVFRHEPLQAVLAAARAAGVRTEQRHAGAAFHTGGVWIRVLHPPQPEWERQRVRNDDSLVLEVRYGEVALLLTGDIGADVERALIPRLSPARVRILKAAHHGSRTSTSRELLDAWKPQVAVISCGRGNPFGHPAPEVVARLEAAGARVYRTDRDGQITVDTDGKAVHIRTFTGGSHEPRKARNSRKP